ncbi:hypothetical protein Ddc_03321 [Ditylenchus destructor]|nr:hypothetical protein Ddc_03321 [Ditylenchus destructor]
MSEYRNFWSEFRAIQESTKKKLLKKPNYNEAISQLHQLSHDMEAEMPEQAAMCHRELSSLYEKVQNGPAEQRHLVKAADLFHKARMTRHNMNMSVIQEWDCLMEECYLKIIEKHIKLGCLKLAGLTCMEVANRFLQFRYYERVYHYFVKANRYVQPNPYIQSDIVNSLCRIAYLLPSPDETIGDINNIWNSMIKDQTFDGVIREMLLKVECNILLLNLRHFISGKESLQKSNLSTYDGQWRTLKTSVMTKAEFTLMSKFVRIVKDGNYMESCKMQAIDLQKYLDDQGKELSFEIVNAICKVPSVDRGFEEIRNSDCSELEKRQMLFELYNNLARKNQLRVEDL